MVPATVFIVYLHMLVLDVFGEHCLLKVDASTAEKVNAQGYAYPGEFSMVVMLVG
jgi:hypothetical protein